MRSGESAAVREDVRVLLVLTLKPLRNIHGSHCQGSLIITDKEAAFCIVPRIVWELGIAPSGRKGGRAACDCPCR